MIIIQIITIILLLILIFWLTSHIFSSIFTAPVVTSAQNAVFDTLSLAKPKKGETVVDLGSGDGSALISAVKKFGVRGIGIEISPFFYFWSKIKIALAGQNKNIKIYFGDFKKHQKIIKTADIVYLYLLNSILADIETWLFSTINPKTRIVVLAFWFPRKKPIQTKKTRTLGIETLARLYQK